MGRVRTDVLRLVDEKVFSSRRSDFALGLACNWAGIC